MKIDISYVIPIYNKEIQSVLDCISSINQINNAIKFEIIIINDGSKPELSREYERIAHEYKTKYFYQENRGVSSARNEGIKRADGKYIYFVDADDIVLPANFKKKDCISQYDLVIYKVAKLNTNIGRKTVEKLDDINSFPSSMALRKFLLKDGLLNWAVGKLYKKKFLLKNNIKFDSNKNVGEDFYFVVKVLNSNPKIQYLNRITYMYLYNDKTGIARDIVDPKKSVENAKSIEKLRFNILSTINKIENKREIENVIYNNFIKSVFEIYTHVVHFDREKAKRLNRFFTNILYKKKNRYLKCNSINLMKRFLVKNKVYSIINLYLITKQQVKIIYKYIND